MSISKAGIDVEAVIHNAEERVVPLYSHNIEPDVLGGLPGIVGVRGDRCFLWGFGGSLELDIQICIELFILEATASWVNERRSYRIL